MNEPRCQSNDPECAGMDAAERMLCADRVVVLFHVLVYGNQATPSFRWRPLARVPATGKEIASALRAMADNIENDYPATRG